MISVQRVSTVLMILKRGWRHFRNESGEIEAHVVFIIGASMAVATGAAVIANVGASFGGASSGWVTFWTIAAFMYGILFGFSLYMLCESLDD